MRQLGASPHYPGFALLHPGYAAALAEIQDLSSSDMKTLFGSGT
jgi:hypothetical protein